MSYLLKATILGFSILLFITCDTVTEPLQKSKRQVTAQEEKLISSDNRFGLKLFKEIDKLNTDKNLFISPLSVSMALGMVLNGAVGDTREAMESALELQGLTQEQINQSYQSLIQLLRNLDPKVVFQIANSIWYRHDLEFEQDFINLNRKYFDASVTGLNFTDPNSVNIINNWVDQNTNGKIKEIIDQLSPLDIMVLVNAIYFKGTWTYQFKKELTREDDFHLPGGSTVKCRMMHQQNKFNYQSNDEFQAVDLPYGDGDFRMTIILPKPNIEVNTLLQTLDDEKLGSVLQGFSGKEGTLEFPAFKLEYRIGLNDVLRSLGMGIAFDPNKADFTKLYNGPLNAYISSVLHKTWVEVNEEGTEAAAVTSVTVGVTSIGGDSPFYMHCNRPFIFFIRENHSSSILFAGKIMNPEA
ncbi:MAG: serpin family protein [Calditrichia bacterium]